MGAVLSGRGAPVAWGIAAGWLGAGCVDLGRISAPDGWASLRTARYRIDVREGGPELVILLSNGVFDCGLPSYPETDAQAEAYEALIAAACREGARHVALQLYTAAESSWAGTYPGSDRASAEALSADFPHLARGSFYGVDEALLVELDGLYRGYTASEDTYLPDLGDGGTVVVEPEHDDPADPGRLRGWFSFPEDGVSGEFAAELCTGDTQLLDVIAIQPTHYCQ